MKNNYQTLKMQLNRITQKLLTVVLLTFAVGANAQYCNTSLGGGCGNGQINDFSIVSTTLSNLNSGCGTNLGIPNYNKYVAAGNKTATLNQAASYTFTGKFDATTVGAGVWIDYDHNGSFDASEFTPWTAPSATASSITVSIPNYATLGTTVMRVRAWNNTFTGSDACTYFWGGGETEDYTITIGAGTPCVGVPTAGVLSASTLTPCTGTLTTLNLTGATNAVGITCTWQTSIDNVNWSATGDTLLQSLDYGLATGDSVYYRVQVACNAGTPVNSNSIKLTTNTSTYACYCSSSATYAYDNIGAFSFGSFNNIQSVTPAINNPAVVNLYTNYTNLGPIQIQQGATSLVSITQINKYNFNNCTATVFIDLDHSGTYDAGEDVYTGYSSNISNVIIGSITIPDSALTGITGVRIVLSESFPNSCGSYFYGETEDYLININPAVPCAGAPTAGTLNITDTMVCAGTNLNLVLAGNTQSSGITTEWETSADGITGWTATGDTIPLLSVYAPSDSIYYRVKVSCNAGAPVYSMVSKIKGSPAYLCYCSTNLNTDCFGAKINNVTIAGTTLNNTTTCNGTGYALFYPTTISTTANLQQALTYTVTVSMPNATVGGVWLDTDLSGTFDGTEYTALSISGTTGTANVNIPSTTPIGKIGMRVRTYGNNFPPFSSGSACSYLFGGEVEDYVVNIVTGIPCSTPVAGTLSATNSAPCSGTTDTLNLVGATQAVGITYTWETSTDGLSWSATGDSSLQSFDYGIATGDSIYYRVQVACNAGTPVISNIIKLQPNTNTYGCYCTSQATSFADDDIGAFSFGSFNNIQSVTPSLNNPVSVNLYTNYTTLGPISAQQAASYPISITQINQYGFYNCYATIYIDFDHSGTYDAGEDVYTGYTANASSNVLTGNVFIPSTAMTGITGVRVVLNENNTSACGTYSYGETEDYLINIAAGVACAGVPTAGTLNTTDTSICPGNELNLVLLGNTQAVGITTEWETSADGITGWAATGDTLPNLTVYGPSDSIYYRVKVSCNGGAPVYTLVTKITASPTYACYCSSNLQPNCYAAITNVTLGGTTLNNSTNCSGGYTSYYPTTANTTTNLTQALSYTLNVATTSGVLTGVWIDYDQSGSFDGTEYTDLIMSASNGTATISIPASALLGKTGMRIRTTPSTWPGLNGGSACSNLFGNSGEIEDYVINIVPGVPCAGTPNAGVLSTTATSLCSSDFAMLTIAGQTQALNIHTVWESSADGTTGWTATGDSSLSLQVFAPSDSIYYRIAVDCNGGAPVYTNVIKLTASPYNLCYCTNNLGGQCGQGNVEDIIIPTTTLNNTATGCSNNFGIANYSRFPDTGNTTATLTQTGSYNITGKFDSLVKVAVVWIDYNQDGSFDFSEIAQWSNPSATASSVTITVPASAMTGKTGMRIRTSAYSGNVLDACNAQWGGGETEDYIVSIAAATLCAGAPSAGTISTTATKMCATELATLTLSGTTIGLGIHTAWQTSPNGSTAWVSTGDSAATLSINAPADSMYYRVAVGCNAGTLVYSNVIKIKLNTTFYECYCASAAQYNYDNDIGGVTIGTFSNNQSLTPSTFNAASVNTYTNYKNLGPISLLKSTLNNPITITQIDNFNFNTCNIAVYIDYDHSGTFDNGEEILTGTTNNSTGGNVLDSVFTIPATALNGVTGLRVILTEYDPITSSCGNYFVGETEDYLVTIADSILTPTQLITKNNTISFIAYPNPTMDVVNIALEGNTSDAVKCEVMNNFGQIVYTNVTKQLNGVEKLKVDLSAYASGAYTIRVIANNNVTVKRILLQR